MDTSITDLSSQITEFERKVIESQGTSAHRVFVNILEHLKEKQTKKHFFQAVGWLNAKLTLKDKKYILVFQEKEYPCFLLHKNNGGFLSRFKDYFKFVFEKEMVFGVYPVFKHFPDKNTPPVLTFHVFSWGELPQDKILNKFYINGLWQFISVSKYPVISVYRNNSRFENDKLKTNHCSVFWRDAAIKPFRYTPNAKTLSKPCFVETICDFDVNHQNMTVTKVVEISKELPSFKKPDNKKNQDIGFSF